MRATVIHGDRCTGRLTFSGTFAAEVRLLRSAVRCFCIDAWGHLGRAPLRPALDPGEGCDDGNASDGDCARRRVSKAATYVPG